MRSALQGQLYKLHDPSTYGSGTPLGKKVRRAAKASLVKEKNLKKAEIEEHDVEGLPAIPVRFCNVEPPLLGYSFQDWHHRLCEVCPNVAEFRYASKSQLDSNDPSMSRHAPRMKRVGYIQASTEVNCGDKVSRQGWPSFASCTCPPCVTSLLCFRSRFKTSRPGRSSASGRLRLPSTTWNLPSSARGPSCLATLRYCSDLCVCWLRLSPWQGFDQAKLDRLHYEHHSRQAETFKR
eukprot:766583-Hanusia_phi.AAC.6